MGREQSFEDERAMAIIQLIEEWVQLSNERVEGTSSEAT